MTEKIVLPGNTRHIHLSGIAGIGVSALAPALVQRGFTVSGSDPIENETTEQLSQIGIRITHEQRAENVEGASLLVISSAVKESNPEIQTAKEKGIPVWPRAKMLGYLIQELRSIVVTGTHGKTSTTAMIAQVLTECGLDPTVFLGGHLSFFGGNVRLGKGEWAVVEGDESDGSFTYLRPDIAVVNNIDSDHLDHYQNIEAIVQAFQVFLQGVKEDGWILLSADCDKAVSLLKTTARKRRTYGFSDTATVRGVEYCRNGRGWGCDVSLEQKFQGPLRLRVSGRANCHNALAVIGVGDLLGLPFDRIVESLARFEGVKRRMEEKGTVRGVTVVDDYAHHPTEIRATISGMRDRYNGRLIGIFQPHLYTRTMKLLEEFERAFQGLDLLILTDIYPAREAPIPGISGEILLSPVRKQGVPVVYIPRVNEIPKFLKEVTREGDIVVTLGAGDVWKVGKDFIEQKFLDSEEVSFA